MSTSIVWDRCLVCLQDEISAKEFNMWIGPLHARMGQSRELFLFAPNAFVRDKVQTQFLARIVTLLEQISQQTQWVVSVRVGSLSAEKSQQASSTCVNSNVTETRTQQGGTPGLSNANGDTDAVQAMSTTEELAKQGVAASRPRSYLNPLYTFDSFVQGPANQMAYSAAHMVAQQPGQMHNPLFICGDVGLGKTHLMHAIGSCMQQMGQAVLMVHAETFVADMIRALQHNHIEQFRQQYRNGNLLLDDVQFFIRKERSQEELLHMLNILLERQYQMILTCDRYPKELVEFKSCLRSRLVWGLTVGIEPPNLETRIAILHSKAAQVNTSLPEEVACFIAEHIQSNVRELEGALKRVIAHANFAGQAISLDFARQALKDLLAVQAKLVTIDNIQKVVERFYKVKHADMVSKRRDRSIVRARQMAMYLAKSLTSASLPEIGQAFGGRDHTTVIHACRKMVALMESTPALKEDYQVLIRILTA